MVIRQNITFVFKNLLTMPSNVLPLHLKHTLSPIIWIFTEGEGDGIKPRLPFKVCSTLLNFVHLTSGNICCVINWPLSIAVCQVSSSLLPMYFWMIRIQNHLWYCINAQCLTCLWLTQQSWATMMDKELHY